MRNIPIIVAIIACVVLTNFFVPKVVHFLVGIYLGAFTYHLARGPK